MKTFAILQLSVALKIGGGGNPHTTALYLGIYRNTGENASTIVTRKPSVHLLQKTTAAKRCKIGLV